MGFMSINPEYLTYEEHSFLGSNFPAPTNTEDYYIVTRKLLVPRSPFRIISNARIGVGTIPIELMARVLGFDELLMNLEEIDRQGKTVRSPRLFLDNDDRNEVTQDVYRKLLSHPQLSRAFSFLRSEFV